MLRLALSFVAVAPVLVGTAIADTRQALPPEVVRPAVAIGRCGMINIGTPERPRMVKDPACSRGNQ